MAVREQILKEATKQFAARGYEGTSLQAVADAVGIRKASLLYHFPSKKHLRSAVLDRLLSRWRERVPRLLLAATSGKDQFEAVIQEVVRFFVADPDRARILVREALDRPDEMRHLLEVHVQPWAGMVCNHIRQGQTAGRVYADLDPEAYVAQVVNLVIGSVATFDCVGALFSVGKKRKKGEPDPLERHVAELLRIARYSLFRPSADHHAPQGGGTRD